MQCWFWNIDLPSQPYFRTELEHGRLRQGWGYEDNLDLRKLKTKIDKSAKLDEKEHEAWSHCQSMLAYIKPDDLVVVKNIPSSDKFTIVKITGAYNYRIDEEAGDFGHMLPTSGPQVFAKYAKAVPAPLLNALNRAQAAIIPTYKHHETVIQLYAVTDEQEKNKPEEFAEKFRRWQQVATKALKAQLAKDLSPKQAERLILMLLSRNRPDGSVLWTAGPKEHGADFVVTVDNGYGLATSMGVQAKMHWDVDDDTRGLDQLEQAFREHKVDTCLLVTFAESLGTTLSQRIADLKQRYKVEVLYGDNLYGRLLELLADPDVDPTQNI
jgi:hypothetical protein